MCRSFFLIKLFTIKPATLLKRDTLHRLLKTQVLTNCFSLSLSCQRAAISKNPLFSGTALAAASLDYTVDYIILHRCG